jgi:HEAT repeat protein
MPAELASLLEHLFDAERAVRKAQTELAKGKPNELLPLLRKTVESALSQGEDVDAGMRLARSAELLGEIDGPDPVDLLIDVLSADAPEARLAAGEALEERAFARFKEVALGIERALVRLPKNSPALSELPYLLAEVPEPGVLPLLNRFLGHESADAVASSIEALAQLGDPAARQHLRARIDDKRTVDLGDEDAESTKVTIGELAREAISLLDEVAAAEGQTRTRGKGR